MPVIQESPNWLNKNRLYQTAKQTRDLLVFHAIPFTVLVRTLNSDLCVHVVYTYIVRAIISTDQTHIQMSCILLGFTEISKFVINFNLSEFSTSISKVSTTWKNAISQIKLSHARSHTYTYIYVISENVYTVY